MRHRMEDDLYVIGNKQFLADTLNSVLYQDPKNTVPAPHYLHEDTMLTSVLDVNTIFKKIENTNRKEVSIYYCIEQKTS